MTSCDPLRLFVYKDGLVRFATIKYTEPTNSNLVSEHSYFMITEWYSYYVTTHDIVYQVMLSYKTCKYQLKVLTVYIYL